MSGISRHNLSAPALKLFFSWSILIVANVLWASSYLVAKWALQDVSVPIMLALRMSISGLILLPFVFIRRKEFHLTRQDLFHLLILSVIGFMVNKMLEFGGLSLSTASDVALLIAGEGIFTLALSWIVLREPMRPRSIFSLLLGVFGAYLVIERGLVPTFSSGGMWRILGDLMVLLALVCEAFYTIYGKSLLKRQSPFFVTAVTIIGSMVFWIPVAGVDALFQGWHTPSLLAWLCVVWMALGCTVLAYLAWFQGLALVSSSMASATLFLQPLLGPLLGVIFLHDILTRSTIIGGILIIISVFLISVEAQRLHRAREIDLSSSSTASPVVEMSPLSPDDHIFC